MSTDNDRPRIGPRIGEEIARMPAEPLLPVEKKLIAGSLILGVVLLAVLIWTGNGTLPGVR
jgi:hypothetical protein